MKTRLVKILFVAWSDPAGGKEEQKIAVVRGGPGREHLRRINFISVSSFLQIPHKIFSQTKLKALKYW